MERTEENPIPYGHRTISYREQDNKRQADYIARSDRMEFATGYKLTTIYNRDIVQEGLLDRSPDDEHPILTPSQTEVLKQIASGKSNPEIAEMRGTQLQTVKNQVSGIMIDLGAKNRTHTIMQGIRQGFLNIDEL